MPSFAILTSVLHEHAYINAFLSHYRNLGFDAFYLLCDKFQPSYEPFIDSELRPLVRLIPMDYSIHHLSKISFDALQIQQYRRAIRNYIREEWILLCDVDEFLYLPCGNIQEFMKPLPTDVSQVSFPWMMTDSLGEDYIHLFDHLREKKWYINPHVKSIFRKSSIVSKAGALVLSTHCAMVNGRTSLQNGFLPPLQFKAIHPNRFHPDFYQKHACMIHFHTRSFKNNIIKILTNKYAGKSDSSQKAKLLSMIKQKKYDYKTLTKFSLIRAHRTVEIPHFELTGFNQNILPIHRSYNDDLFQRLLDAYNLDATYFEPIWADPESILT